MARKWGLIEDSKALDDLTFKQYIDLYKKPLSVDAMAAISKLTEVAKKKKKKQGKISTAATEGSKKKKLKKQAVQPV